MSVGGGSKFNKGTLDAYRRIICRELGVESGSTEGKAWISGSLVVVGDISGSHFTGVSGTGIGDMLKVDYATSGSKVVDHAVDSDYLAGQNITSVRTHSPAVHGPTHTSGSSDPTYVFKNQVVDFNDALHVTGSGISSVSGSMVISGSLTISGSLIVSGSISGSIVQGVIAKNQITDFNNYPITAPQLFITGAGTSWFTGSIRAVDYISGANIYGPTMRVRTGSGTATYQRQRINFVNAGNLIVSMTDSSANDEIVVSLQATGSGGGATSFADYVSSSNVYNQVALVGTDAVMVARADHVHGTPGLYNTAPADISGSSYSGSSASGSHGDHTHRGVLSLAASGSSDLYTRTYLTGSTPNIAVTQSGQVLQVAMASTLSGLTNLYATNVSGSTISGSTYVGSNAFIGSLSGSTISGSTFSGSKAVITNVIATNMSGSGIVSGASILGSTIISPNIYATDLSGSNISGSIFSGSSSYITNIMASNISGSNISGSTFTGSSAYITNVYVTNISGSGNISGSHIGYGNFTSVVAPYISGSVSISGSLLVATSARVTNLDADYLTGSIMISGSEFRFGSGWASWISGSNISGSDYLGTDITAVNITGSAIVSGSSLYGKDGKITNLTASIITGSTISGGAYQGNIVTSVAKSGSAAIVGDITLEQGSSIVLTQSGKNIKFDVSSPVDPSTSVESETTYGISPNAGLSGYYSRGDHTHGTPALSKPGLTAPLDISDTASAGTSASGSAMDHVHRGVLSLANSGSTELYSRIYLTGSGAVSITQSGQIITLSGSTGTGSGGSGTGTTTGSEIPATYVIWSGSDGLYYSQHGHTGVMASGANASTIIQNALSTLTTGGAVFIKAGDYASIDIDINNNNVALLGEGIDATTLYLAANGSIDCSNASAARWNIRIADMTIDGGNNSHSGVHTDSQGDNLKAANFVIERVEFTNFNNSGYYPISLKNHETVTIRDCYIHGFASGTVSGANSAGIRLWATGATGYYAGNVLIENNQFDPERATTNCIVLDTSNNGGKECDYYVIRGNHFLNSGKYLNVWAFYIYSANGQVKIVDFVDNRQEGMDGIYASGAARIRFMNVSGNFIEASGQGSAGLYFGPTVRESKVYGNHFDVNSTRTGIVDLNTTVDQGTLIHGNIFSGSGGAGTFISGCTVDKIYDNLGYVTEKTGYASVTNGGTIAHGCSQVPTAISLLASGSTPAYFSYTTDATNITVYHTVGGSLGVFWRAEV